MLAGRTTKDGTAERRTTFEVFARRLPDGHAFIRESLLDDLIAELSRHPQLTVVALGTMLSFEIDGGEREVRAALERLPAARAAASRQTMAPEASRTTDLAPEPPHSAPIAPTTSVPVASGIDPPVGPRERTQTE